MAGKLMESLQTDLSTRLYRVTNGFNEALYLTANEPSLGMYRLQEHVHATVPKVVEQKQSLQQVCQHVDGTCYDLGYDIQTVHNMSRISQFPIISAHILQAVQLKNQLDDRREDNPTPPANLPVYTDPVNTTSINSDSDLKPKTFD